MTASSINSILKANGVTCIEATDGKRAVKFWKKYQGQDAGYQISKSEAIRYCSAIQ